MQNYATCFASFTLSGYWNLVKCSAVMKEEDGNIHDRFACGIYLRAALVVSVDSV